MGSPSLPGGSGVTQPRTFVYNCDQRLQSVTNPENGTTTYTYNADGSMATKTDANTQVLSYYYDTLGRLTQVKTGSYILRTLTYDANGGYGSYLAGRLAKVDYGVGNSNPYGMQGNAWTELYSYDAAGGMLKKKLTLARNNFYPHNVSGSLEASWEYDDEGKVKSIQYPTFYQGGYPTAGPTYTYTFDSMARPLSLSDGTNTMASAATYGPAGEMTALQYAGMSESRTYNEQKQLTGIAVYGLGAITYNYPATQNNGRIASMSSTMTGETVTYAYDSLNRLISATSAGQWGLDFSYDGFGNRLTQTLQQGQWQGYVPTIQQSYDMTKNRLLDQTYDANGNMLGLSYPATFDVENRLVASNTDTYDYAPDNKRIYKYTPGTNPLQEVYFYAGGRKIATYTFYLPSDPDDPDVPANIQFVLSSYNLYFGGKLIVSNGQGVVLDRLGSVVARAVNVNSSVFERHTYFPYGEERTSNGLPTPNNRDKFGTYFRDAGTGLDYADQRYYSSQFGRFASSDPYQASGGTNDPSSWNRYGYVGGDPINRFDQSGTCWASVSAGGTTSSEYYDCTSLLASSLLASSTPYKPPSPTSSLAQYVDVHPSDALDIAQARKAIGQDVKLALAALGKKDCSKHFGTEQSRAGSWDPKTVLSTIFSTSGGYVGGTSAYVGFAVYKSYPILAAATVGPAVFAGGNTGGVAVGFRVDINAQNWNDMGVGTGNIGLQYQAAGLLHEMGHIYSALDSLGFGSGGSDMKFDGLPWQGDTSNENNALILKDCFGITN